MGAHQILQIADGPYHGKGIFPIYGLQIDLQRQVPALVYFWDSSATYEKRTAKIQNEVLFDPEVREAADRAVPVLAPRSEAGKLLPDARLKPGPALVVLDAAGEVVGVLQQKLSADSLVALLRGR